MLFDWEGDVVTDERTISSLKESNAMLKLLADSDPEVLDATKVDAAKKDIAVNDEMIKSLLKRIDATRANLRSARDTQKRVAQDLVNAGEAGEGKSE
jgi:hypothetical protein